MLLSPGMGAALGAPQVQGVCRSWQGCAYGAHVLRGSGCGTGPPAALSVSRAPNLPRSEPPPSPSRQPGAPAETLQPVHTPSLSSHTPRDICLAEAMVLVPPSLSFPQLPSGAGAHSAVPKWGLGSGVWVPALLLPPRWPAAGHHPQQQGALCVFGGALPACSPLGLRPCPLALLMPRLNGPSVCLRRLDPGPPWAVGLGLGCHEHQGA